MFQMAKEEAKGEAKFGPESFWGAAVFALGLFSIWGGGALTNSPEHCHSQSSPPAPRSVSHHSTSRKLCGKGETDGGKINRLSFLQTKNYLLLI